MANSRLPEIIARNEEELLGEWLRLQKELIAARGDRVSESQLRSNSQQFLRSLSEALASASASGSRQPDWSGIHQQLGEISRQRAAEGFSSSETAGFIFSFKQPLFIRISLEYADDRKAMEEEIWNANQLLDNLGLYTVETFQKSREDVIIRQQEEMLELSTPVIELWQGILALPLIGTLDSARTQIVMQNLLEAIVSRSSDLAIIDITGVPTVDTLVAQHLLKTIAAARLMGADCIISGIRPQIAQTIIHLGVDLSGVITKATLADAFTLALKKKSLAISRS